MKQQSILASNPGQYGTVSERKKDIPAHKIGKQWKFKCSEPTNGCGAVRAQQFGIQVLTYKLSTSNYPYLAVNVYNVNYI